MVETAVRGRPFDVEHADNLVAGPERDDDGLAGERVAPAKPCFVDRPVKDYPFAPAGDPTGDPLVHSLTVPEGDLEPDRGAYTELVALDEHDRGAAGADPSGDLLGGAREQCGGPLGLVQPRQKVLEEPRPVDLLGGLAARLGEQPAISNAHRQELGRRSRRRELDGVERHAVAQPAEERLAVGQVEPRDQRICRLLVPATGRNRRSRRCTPERANDDVGVEDPAPVDIGRNLVGEDGAQGVAGGG